MISNSCNYLEGHIWQLKGRIDDLILEFKGRDEGNSRNLPKKVDRNISLIHSSSLYYAQCLKLVPL